MKTNAMLLLRVAGEIESELAGFEKLRQEYLELPKQDASYILRAKASIFHDFYTAVERTLKLIAEELNGGVPKGDQWHKQLLVDMTLDLADIRPPVFSKELFERSLPFLRFRHLFRNMYGYELKAEKIRELETGFPRLVEDAAGALFVFCAWLKQTATAG
jgi:hypothetical protein